MCSSDLGVPEERFPGVVAAACRGGASGFLAGRAIWGAAVGAADPATVLAGRSLETLDRLTAIVAAEARPWHDVAPDPGGTRRA